MRLHKQVIFCVYIATPLLMLSLYARLNLADSATFVAFLTLYCLVYHPWISGKRLVALGVIPPSKLIYSFIPFWKMRYFDYLFLNAKVPEDA